jgi:carotenoid cleavage dioxygenase
MDLPVVFSPELVAEGRFPYRWSDDYGARLGLLPRGAGVEALRWLDVEPCYVFHPFTAYEDGGRVVVDVCRYPELWRDEAEHFVPAAPHRFILDPQRGRVTEQALGDEAIEFPRIDDRRTGLAHRYGYAVGQPADAGVEGSPRCLLKVDFASGAREMHDFGEGRHPGEGVFVPGGAGPGEDDGYVLTFVYDAARDTSELHVLDASHFGAPPLARVSLPRRVPFGFHGNWIPDAR